MSKLKKISNHTSPLNHAIVEQEVTNGAPAKRDTTKPFTAGIKELAVELLGELPLVPNNDNIAVLLEGLSTSSVGDLPLEDAYKNWDQLLEEARKIFETKSAPATTTTASNSRLRIKLNNI